MELRILVRMLIRGNDKQNPTSKKRIGKGSIKKESPEAVERSLQKLAKPKVIIRKALQFFLHPDWEDHIPPEWWEYLSGWWKGR